MVDRPLPTRSRSESRLNIHSANMNEEFTDAGLCGTVNLVTGGVCHLPALHDSGCDFHRTVMPAPTTV